MALSKESAGELFSQSFRNRMFLLDRFIQLELDRLASTDSTRFNRASLLASLSKQNMIQLTESQRRIIGFIPETVKFTPFSSPQERRTAQDRIRRQIETHRGDVNQFVNKDVRDIYKAGAESVTPGAKLNRTQVANVKKLQTKTATYLNNALNDVHRNAAQLRSVKAKNPLDFSRKVKNVGKVIVNGRRYDFGRYTDLVATTEAQRAFNTGVIDEAVNQETKYFEVVDGTDCGWTNHDDTEKANGMVVSASEARAYPMAHPNCVRRFIPRPDIKTKREATKAQKTLQASKVEKLARQVGAVAAQALAKQAIDIGAQLAFSLATDQQFRGMVFASYENGLQRLSKFTERIHRVRNDLAARALGIVPTEDEIMTATSNWIDEFMKDEVGAASKMPSFAYEILTGRKATFLQRFKGKLPSAVGDHIMMEAENWSDFEDLRAGVSMTHQGLNIRNSIESEFGGQFFNSMSRIFGNTENARQTIQELAQTYATRYAPNAGNVRTAAGWVKNDPSLQAKFKGQIRGEAYRRFLKSRVDEVLTHMPTLTEDGHWTIIGNILNLNRKDLLGIKYNYVDNRLIRVQADFIDKWRHYPTTRLKQIALSKGMEVSDVTRIADPGGLIGEVRKSKTRQAIIDQLGYSMGMLGHITVNRNGLIRMGFQFSPYYGWRFPIPRLTIQAPKNITGLRPKFTTTINRGALPGIGGLRREVAAGNLAVEGMRLRTATSELSIALGRTFVGPGGIMKLLGATVQGPGVLATGVRFKTELGQLHNFTDVKSFFANAERIGFQHLGATNKAQAVLKGVGAQTEVLRLFMEMRLLGYRWLRLGKIVGLDATQTRSIVRATQAYWGRFSPEMRARTVESYIKDSYRGDFNLSPEGLTNLVEHYVRLWEFSRMGRTTEVSDPVAFAKRVKTFQEWFKFQYAGKITKPNLRAVPNL